MRRFSVFTQRSLGEADRVELAPAAELSAEHRDQVDPESFLAPLELVPGEALVVIAAAEEIPGALHDHWEDVTAVDGSRRMPAASTSTSPGPSRPGPVSHSALTAGRSIPSGRSGPSPSRTLAEAQGELEKLTRSGYGPWLPSRGAARRSARAST